MTTTSDDFARRYPAAMLTKIYADAARVYDATEAWDKFRPCCIAAIFNGQRGNWYQGCLQAEKKWNWLYQGCVAENDDHAILMLLFAAEYFDG